ncbi:MAG: NADH-quinone oxidoreductase subunit NuoH [Actinobacteria bacterium]|nr:NADH-quinone oxidoreductase subunit NuoH [Actinomycetota bacterium]
MDAFIAALIALGLFAAMGLGFMVQVYMERKVSAGLQLRYGPIYVGPKGSLQLVADALKFITKEDVFPSSAEPWIFRLAPVVMFAAAFLGLLVLPFGPGLVAKDLNVGLIYVLAIPSIGVAGVIMAGFGSKNRYAILGSLRAAAQMISYEVPRSLSLIGIIMIAGTMRLSSIVDGQGIWYIFLQPLGFLVFFVATMAELNRTPFDLAESESEYVNGYHTEYSGMRFGFFFFAEYMSLFAAALLTAVLFLGGWHGPGPVILAPVWLLIKVFGVIYVLMWVRWTFPRFRIDQVMDLGWKVLLPMALVNILVTGIIMSV